MEINKSKRSNVWGIVAVIITAAVTGKILWSIDDWGRDFTTNHARLDDAAVDPRMRRPQLPIPVDAAREQIAAWVESQSRWKVNELKDEADSVTMHLTRTTPLMRFVDDIHVTLRPVDPNDRNSATLIDAESRSRLGSGDLGQNPRNLIELSESWRSD